MIARLVFASLILLLGTVIAKKSPGTTALETADGLQWEEIDPSEWDLVCRLVLPEKTTPPPRPITTTTKPPTTTTTKRPTTTTTKRPTTTTTRRPPTTTTKPPTTTTTKPPTTTTTKPQTTTTKPRTTTLSLDNECGISTARVNNRIIGGEFAEPHTWPWQVLLNCANSTHYTSCGGSLIIDGWVVTAAHCISSKIFSFDVLSQCSVSLGKHNFSNYPVDTVVIKAGIKSFFVHNLYDYAKPQLGYDIALLKLDKTISYNDAISPICLSFDLPELDSDSFCYTTGWGIDDLKKNVTSAALKQLQMPIQEDDFCGFTRAAIGPIICTGNWEWRQDICNGDSGGPLACKEKNGKWYLRGVASMAAYGCNSVASYTKVTGLKDWIISTLLMA